MMDELNKVYGEVKGASVLDRGPWRAVIAHEHLPKPVQIAVNNVPRAILWRARTIRKTHPSGRLAKYITLSVAHRCSEKHLQELRALLDAVIKNHFIASEHQYRYCVPVVGRVPIHIKLRIDRRKSLMVTIKKQTFKEKNRQAK